MLRDLRSADFGPFSSTASMTSRRCSRIAGLFLRFGPSSARWTAFIAGSATASTKPSDHALGHKMDKLRRTRAYQPVLTDIRSIAPTGWFGSPQHATAEKGHKMLNDICDAIAKEAREIYRQLDAVQGGPREIKQLRQVG